MNPPNLVDFILHNFSDHDFIPKMKLFLKNQLHTEEAVSIVMDNLLFENEPVLFKKLIFGRNRTFEVDRSLSKARASPRKCWVCGERIEKGTEKLKKIDPIVLTIVYTSFLLTVPSLPKPLSKSSYNLPDEAESVYCHPCCDVGRKELFWIAFNGSHFYADDHKVKKGLKIVQDRKNCNKITPSNINKRSEAVKLELNNFCEYLQNEIDSLKLYFTPTYIHLRLWTLYISYILCILHLKFNIPKPPEESTTIATETTVGFGKKQLVKRMNSLKEKIVLVKRDLRTTRVYGKTNILKFCDYHFEEYCRDNIIDVTEKEKENMSKFFEVSLNIKHTDALGQVLFQENFADVFGWSYYFIVVTISFLDQRSCPDFFKFLVEFHRMYRAYHSFWEDFFEYYREDPLYIKFKENMKHFFQFDLTHFEDECPNFVKKTMSEDDYIPFLKHDDTDYQLHDDTSTIELTEKIPVQKSRSKSKRIKQATNGNPFRIR